MPIETIQLRLPEDLKNAAMRQAASDVNEGARQTRASTSSTVEGAAATARDLNSVAAAAEEMAVSINEKNSQLTTTSLVL